MPRLSYSYCSKLLGDFAPKARPQKLAAKRRRDARACKGIGETRVTMPRLSHSYCSKLLGHFAPKAQPQKVGSEAEA